MHKLLGIHDRFENCIAYAPYGKYAPHCSRNINRANMQRRPGLLAELLQANIPSSQARTLLKEISHYVVCGITGWHQPESDKIFKEWCKKLWLNYLRAHGLDPELCLSSPETMSRRSWRLGLLTARIEHDAQLAILAGSSASDSETESEDQTDASSDSDDGGDDDDDGDNGGDDGSDDGDNADDTTSDGTDDPDSDLVILTPRSNTPNSEHGDDLASTASSRTLDHSPSYYQNMSARSSRVNSDHNSSASSSSSSTVNRTTQQAGPTVVSVSRSSKCAVQESSTRLQVYRDPLPPPQPPKQKHQASAGTSGSTKITSTTSLPTDTRRALGTLERNIDIGSQDRAPKTQPGPSRPRRDTQHVATAKQQRAGGDDREALSDQAEPFHQSVIERFEGVGNYDNTIRQQKRRPCSRCRGCGYRIVDDGPLATEEDILQMLSQFDVIEKEQDEDSMSSKSSLSPTKKGFRIYNPQLTPRGNMKSIFNTILQHSGPRNRAPGYIYAFTRPSLPGFLKIGYTNAVHHPDRPYPDPVDSRLARWASDCGHPVVEAFRAYMPCAAERMESLIHQTLREYRRVEDPGCRPCQRRRRGGGEGSGGGAHDEWFEVDVEVAQRVVSLWALFSAQRPYDSFGRPVGFWAQRVERERRRARDVLDVGEWLENIPRYIEEMMRLDFRSIIGSTRSLIS